MIAFYLILGMLWALFLVYVNPGFAQEKFATNRKTMYTMDRAGWAILIVSMLFIFLSIGFLGLALGAHNLDCFDRDDYECLTQMRGWQPGCIPANQINGIADYWLARESNPDVRQRDYIYGYPLCCSPRGRVSCAGLATGN